MKLKFLSMVGMAAIGLATPASAATLNVLWYGQSATYNTAMTGLAAGAASYDPSGDGSNDWNLTIWNPGDPTPTFGNYDVLVIGSSQIFGLGFDGTRLLAASDAIADARGSRTFISGQDADYHYMVSPGPVDNGPRGFLINAVNWAGSGTGLGIVSLPDGFSGSGSQWWCNAGSFFQSELCGSVSYYQEEGVVIPAATATFPINEGLTTAGLSNWGVSAHLALAKTIPGYLSINDSASNGLYSVTLVTEDEAGGCTDNCGGGNNVPEPATLVLLTVAAFVGVRRARIVR
ncbi:MAG TPA: PEP-CTERM sorting domain-containing protein [Luteitalea sp.]|nr:PEP-CTERM sorting domain-containing protein [Luteitalea sp.]